ncbi:MAG: hypothetical protein Q7T20_08845 [Saprospiraceae bacterium]|nr:hypothetical protein [Saprospiraceae bacterium]
MMQTLFRFICLMLAMAHIQTLFAQKQSDWEYKGEKDGIKIYHQKTPGLLHIKLATSVKAPLSGIAALFSDVDQYSVWGYKMSHSRLLHRVSPTEVWYYAKYDLPWPLDDRDIILQSKMQQDPVTRRIVVTNTPHPAYLPEYKGIMRIKNTNTRWTFVPGKDGWVYLEQQIATDSAKDMPEWFVNMTADTGPRETAKAVRKILKKEQYQAVKLAHIKD